MYFGKYQVKWVIATTSHSRVCKSVTFYINTIIGSKCKVQGRRRLSTIIMLLTPLNVGTSNSPMILLFHKTTLLKTEKRAPMKLPLQKLSALVLGRSFNPKTGTLYSSDSIHNLQHYDAKRPLGKQLKSFSSWAFLHKLFPWGKLDTL